MKPGVTMVVCCHNSVKRLPSTLSALAFQEVSEEIPWEVLIVDNASTDGTAAAAEGQWKFLVAKPSFRVIQEPQLGLIYARMRALKEAKYEYVSFIDDDNQINPDWVELVYEVMSRHPEVGALGGLNEPVYEAEPPAWFSHYLKFSAPKFVNSYALGPQGPAAGDVTDSRGFLWGAGWTLRKSAWQQIVEGGFEPFCVGSQGKRMTRGEDSEICLALQMAGWRLWYEPRLKLKHFLPASRLQWNYLRRVRRMGGASTVYVDLYRAALKDPRLPAFSLSMKWEEEIKGIFKMFAKHWKKLPFLFFGPSEGKLDILELEGKVGKFRELLRVRRDFLGYVERIFTLQKKLKGRALVENSAHR